MISTQFVHRRVLRLYRWRTRQEGHTFRKPPSRTLTSFSRNVFFLTSLSQESTADLALGDYGEEGGGGGAGGGVTAVQGTLTMLLNHCRSSQEGKAFLYDELALSAGSGALGSGALDTLVEMLSGEDTVVNIKSLNSSICSLR